MGFFVEDPGLIATHILYKTAVVLAVLRWVLSWALRFKDITLFSTKPSSSSSSYVSSDMIRDNLVLTTFGEAKERVPCVSDTCAVCLGELNESDEVGELRNCCHVFHKDCIERWVDFDPDHDHDHEDDENNNHKTCPLCRAPLLNSSSQWLSWPNNEPSWAVERLLYLFGDDLLP